MGSWSSWGDPWYFPPLAASRFRSRFRKRPRKSSIREFRAGEERLDHHRPGRSAPLLLAVIIQEVLDQLHLLVAGRARIADLVGAGDLAGVVVAAGEEPFGQRIGLRDDEWIVEQVE